MSGASQFADAVGHHVGQGGSTVRTVDLVVVGGGVAGLTVANVVQDLRPSASVLVLEAAPQAGGQTMTLRESGYTVELGPAALMVHEPDTAALVDRVSLRERLETVAGPGVGASIWSGGALRPLPRRPWQVVTTSVLSPKGRARVLAEPLLGRKRTTADESVYEFVRRRFGCEAADVVAAAAVQGVTADDARATSLRALWPKLYAADEVAGRSGLLGHAAARAIDARRHPTIGPRGPGTFRDGGLAALPTALASRLGDRLVLGCRVTRVRPGTMLRWAVQCDGDSIVEADTVVLAVPARHAASLVERLAPEAGRLLRAVRYTGLRMVAFGFRSGAFPKAPRGFGFLASPPSDLGIIGAALPGNAFPDQVPAGRVLVRAFGGGVQRPEFMHYSPARAREQALHDLARVWGVSEPPESVWDVSWPQAIPRMSIGHTALVERILEEVGRLPGLHVTGNSYFGVGLDDTIRAATATSHQVLASLLAVRASRPGWSADGACERATCRGTETADGILS